MSANSPSLPIVLCFFLFMLQRLSCGQSLPEQEGIFGVGYERFDANPDANTELNTAIWYPIEAENRSDQAVYSWNDWPYTSPFIGAASLAAPSADGPFPLVVLSHGWGAWPLTFTYLAESLASHGYVVTAPQHSTNDLTPRANELVQAMDAVLNRNSTGDDLLAGVINPDSIAIGGYSHGAATTYTALRDQEIATDAIILIDGSGASWNFDVDVPILHVGGGDLRLETTNSRTVSPELYALDVGRGNDEVRAHHWSFGLNGCQFRENVLVGGLAAGATEEVILESIMPDSFWLGCNAAYIPINDVQQRMNAQTVAFLDHALKQHDEFIGVISAGSEDMTPGDLWLSVAVDSDSTREGLSVLLTDPQGRSIGIDPVTGEAVNDFGNDSLGRADRTSRSVLFGLSHDVLESGDYVLTAVGTSLEKDQNYVVQLGKTDARGDDLIMSRRIVAHGMVMPGGQITPFEFTVSVGPEGDYDGDGLLTASDIDLLSAAVRDQSMDAKYDMNNDGQIDVADRAQWVNVAKQTWFGDANFDAEFNSSDLVSVFQAGQYEDGIAGNSGWASGDWNGDAEFSSADFIVAFQDGGFELGPRTELITVPEPSTRQLAIAAAFGLRVCRARRTGRRFGCSTKWPAGSSSTISSSLRRSGFDIFARAYS